MLQKAILVLILLSFIFYGCKVSNLSSQEVLDTMENANAYTSDAIMKVKNNKSIFIYKLKQYYKKQDKFRIEFYDENDNVKQIIIYNNNQCGIFDTSILKPFISENFFGSKEHNSFLKTFLMNYKADERAYVVLDKMEDKEYYIFKCNAEKGNLYFKNIELYADAKTAIPHQLIIYGENNSKTIEIIYKDFTYNNNLDDLLFEVRISND